MRRRATAKPTTIRDIANSLNVSPMTVSRAIRNHPEINEKTKAMILERVAKMDYTPNAWARSLATNRSNLIGLVIPDIAHAFFSDIASGVQEVASKEGYNVFLCKSDRDPRTEQIEIEGLIEARVHGLIIASQQPETSFEFVRQLLTKKVRFVLIDREFSQLKCPSLTADDEQVGRVATEYLIELGHRRIGHVRGSETSSARWRLTGYQEALKAAGIRARPDWIATGNFNFDDSREAAKSLMRGSEPPTAIFAASDLSAFGTVAGLRELGLSVPGDVSIVGSGNIEGNQHPDPFLTTIDWDRREMGCKATRVLLSLDGNEKPEPERVQFPAKLLLRRSTVPFK